MQLLHAREAFQDMLLFRAETVQFFDRCVLLLVELFIECFGIIGIEPD